MNNNNIFGKVLAAGVTLVGAAFGIKKLNERKQKNPPEAPKVTAAAAEPAPAQEVEITETDVPAEAAIAETVETPALVLPEAEEAASEIAAAEEIETTPVITAEDPEKDTSVSE